jgi:hypothetical protein
MAAQGAVFSRIAPVLWNIKFHSTMQASTKYALTLFVPDFSGISKMLHLAASAAVHICFPPWAKNFVTVEAFLGVHQKQTRPITIAHSETPVQ